MSRSAPLSAGGFGGLLGARSRRSPGAAPAAGRCERGSGGTGQTPGIGQHGGRRVCCRRVGVGDSTRPTPGCPSRKHAPRMWMGQVLRRAGHRNEAQRALEAAASLFAELGTPLYADRARAELGRLGGRVAGPFTLTVTEKRVADLVGAGGTNQEVAETLFVSVRTVESTSDGSTASSACAHGPSWPAAPPHDRLPGRHRRLGVLADRGSPTGPGRGGVVGAARPGWNPATGIWARRGDERATWPVGAFRQQMHLDPTVSSVAELDVAQNRVVESVLGCCSSSTNTKWPRPFSSRRSSRRPVPQNRECQGTSKVAY
jgi:hypothetical protein